MRLHALLPRFLQKRSLEHDQVHLPGSKVVPKPSANGYGVLKCIRTSLPLDFASMFKILRKKLYNSWEGKKKKDVITLVT